MLEGEITQANFTKLKAELNRIISKEKDSVIFYTFRTTKYSKREIMGLEKGGQDVIL